MRKLLLTLVFLVGLVTVVRAEGLKFNSLNLSGDIVFDLREGELGTGAGTSLVSFPDKVTSIRCEWVTFYPYTDNVKNKAGVGLDCNVVSLAQKLGAAWLPVDVNVSLGVLGLLDFVDKPELSFGVYLTIIGIGL